MPETGITQTHRLAFVRRHNARRAVRSVPAEPADDPPPGRVPRITKLMALAIRFEHLLTVGAVRDQTELAELGHVTRARITQIMNLLHLSPTIQEQILFLPRITQGRAPIVERHLRAIAAVLDWQKQLEEWQQIHG